MAQRKKIPFLLVLSLIVLTFGAVSSSKLNLLVLQSSDDIIKQSSSTSGNDSGKIASVWHNEGFTLANATQISNSLGDTVNGSTHFLLATKSAVFSARLKDFGHTFLSIKFSSIIGRSVPMTDTDTLETTTEEDAQQFEMSTQTEFISTSTTEVPETTTEIPDLPTTTTTTTTIKTRKPSPAVLKLNTDNKYGARKEIIKIALAAPPPPEVKSPKTPKAHSSTPPKIIRRKRTLNSEEISQIHKIISSVSTNPDIPDLISQISKQDSKGQIDPEAGSEVTISDSLSQAIDDPAIVLSEPKKLSYGTWRASMDKSFRPPGFYITIDDKVIFDNWIGVWQNPAVMGRWVPPTRQKLWNETELLLEFKEDPNRDIKITFEWEPMDTYSYVFISNITISTYGQDAASSADPIEVPKTSNESKTHDSKPILSDISTSGDGNKNITLYIVLKSNEDSNTEVIAEKSRLPSTGTNIPLDIEISKLNASKEEIKAVNSSITGTENVNKEIPKNLDLTKTIKFGNNKGSSSTKPKSEEKSQTVLYVSCVTGVLFFIILVISIHKKMQLSKRQGKGC